MTTGLHPAVLAQLAKRVLRPGERIEPGAEVGARDGSHFASDEDIKVLYLERLNVLAVSRARETPHAAVGYSPSAPAYSVAATTGGVTTEATLAELVLLSGHRRREGNPRYYRPRELQPVHRVTA